MILIFSVFLFPNESFLPNVMMMMMRMMMMMMMMMMRTRMMMMIIVGFWKDSSDFALLSCFLINRFR